MREKTHLLTAVHMMQRFTFTTTLAIGFGGRVIGWEPDVDDDVNGDDQ